MDHNSYSESPESGYEVGMPYDEPFDVPEYVQLIRDELNEVRAAMGKMNEDEMSRMMGSTSRMDPIEEIRHHQSMEALYKEEDRLQGMLVDAEWILPPMMEPPHNMPTQEKAKKMLHEGTANGKPLSKAQRGLFGVIASGKRPKISTKRG